MGLSDSNVSRLRAISPENTLARDFDVLREAGAGAMGRVYEASHRDTGRRIALKILSRNSPTDRARFAAEAEALERLDHPAIVGYVAHGLTMDGEAFLAMEWLDGITLSQHLESGPLTILETVVLARRVAEALAAAHAQGIIHRDLKPSNLFLVHGRIDAVKVVDFGIAREMGVSRDLTRTGEVVGTPGYMAPEQARGQQLDGRSDLFALGCVLFRCVTGRPAFEGEDILSVLSKLILHDPPRVSQVSAVVPKQLERLVARMLAKDPAGRPASAEEVLAELRPMEDLLSRGEELPAVPPSLPLPGAVASPSPSRLRARLAVAGAIVAVPLIAGAAALALRRAPPLDAPAPAAAALACSDAAVSAGPPLEPDVARTLGVGACARLAIAWGVPWGAGGGTPVGVRVEGAGEATTLSISAAGVETTARGSPLDAADLAAADAERLARARGVLATVDAARWGADSAEAAARAERAWRRFELGLAARLDADPASRPSDSAFLHLTRAVQAKAGSPERTEALEQGLANLGPLPEARRLAVEAHLSFFRDQSPAQRGRALQLVRQARVLDRTDGDVASLATTLFLLAGNRDEGLASLDQLLAEHPTNAVRALRLATSEPPDRDLARSRRYVDAMAAILPETRASPAAVRLLVLEGRFDDARSAVALGARLDPERQRSATSIWLELAALEPEKARQLAAPRLSLADRGMAADAAFAMVGSYLLEGRVAEAQSLEQRQVEALRAPQPVLAAFHAYHNVRVRRWLSLAPANADMVAALAAAASESAQLALSRRTRLAAELALARDRGDVASGRAQARAALDVLEALAESASLGDPVEQQSALVGTVPLLRLLHGDAAAADRFAACERADLEARRRVALDAALAYDALGDDARAADAYRLAMDPIDIASEAFAALVARVKLAALHRRAHREAEAEALEAGTARLLERGDVGMLAALARIR